MAIEVTSAAIEAMRYVALADRPNEACGLLLGEGARVTAFVEARNVHPTPTTHFEIEPQALIDAHRAEREGGPQILGYFHSHPTGEPCPSQTDEASSAKDAKVWAIAAGGDVRFWRDEPGGFRALSYEIVDP